MSKVFVVTVAEDSPYNDNALFEQEVRGVFASASGANKFADELINEIKEKHHKFCTKQFQAGRISEYSGLDDPSHGVRVCREDYSIKTSSKTVIDVTRWYCDDDMKKGIRIIIVEMPVKE